MIRIFKADTGMVQNMDRFENYLAKMQDNNILK